MKRILSAFLAAVFFLSLTVSASAEEEKAAGKVIFDTDIAYLNDDTIALFMLCQADRNGDLELLGVCTVGGNVFAAEATTAALRQLELIERTDMSRWRAFETWRKNPKYTECRDSAEHTGISAQVSFPIWKRVPRIIML